MVSVTLNQRNDIVEDYHQINRNFTHNLAVNYTASILQENDHVLDRASLFYAHNDELNTAVNVDRVRQATVDALTGCKNRRAFDSDVAALINDTQPFALAMVEIDNFKSLNDTRGHLSGDIVSVSGVWSRWISSSIP